MALVVENGSQVAAAVSYATVAEARAYAAARGLLLPDDDEELEVLLVLATDYIEQQEDDFQGTRVNNAQSLTFPRKNVYIRGDLLDPASIPSCLKMAQCQLAVDAATTTLQPTGTGREIIKQKVDVIETEYAPTGSGSITPEFNKAQSYLRPLYKTNTQAGSVSILRV